MLAILLVHADEVVSADGLVDALWGGSPPASARKLLQIYVSQLRKALGGGYLVTRSSGYVLDLNGAALDSARFEQLLGEGRQALRQENPALASALLARALGLWRGPALADLAYEEFAQVEARRLEELRVTALGERIEAELALGRHDGLVGELQALVREHPLRERFRAQLMLALYRSERQAEALATYREGRSALVERLGLEPSSELRELEQAILKQDPGLREVASSPLEPPALPTPLTPLVGRERELEEIAALLREPHLRLLALTGSGGIGKTRLALAAGTEAQIEFANGVFFVELASIRDPTVVGPTIAEALGVRVDTRGGEQLARSLGAALRPQELLLILDNFEHLRAAASTVAKVLEVAPRVKVLVTSRVVLRLSGERAYAVPPLALPRAGEPADVERVSASPAVAVFCERARAVKSDFALTRENASHVADICTCLEGVPLAIELAATRTRTLPPAMLLERLERRLPLLTEGAGDLPARQKTLHKTIEWSYELLGSHTQRVFARLGVFVGGFSLEAAESVCGGDLDVITTLFDNSLIQRQTISTRPRFRLLETIREYALERLEQANEKEEVGRRHAEFMLALAESANLSADTEEAQHHDLVIPEQDNARAAIEWAFCFEEVELALRLAVALENFWVTRNPFESIRWFDRLLELESEVEPLLRARARRAYGGCCMIAGDHRRAEHLYDASLTGFRAAGDKRGTAILLHRLGLNALQGGDTRRARRLLEEGLEVSRRVGSRRAETQALGSLGSVERAEGNMERAQSLFDQSAAMAAALGRNWWESSMLANLAELALEAGRTDTAAAHARQVLTLARRTGDRQATVYALAYLAWAALDHGAAFRAGRLWGAVEAEEARGLVGTWEGERERYASRVLVGDRREVEHGRKEGRRLSLDEAVDYASADKSG